jgi:hypothetical protein
MGDEKRQSDRVLPMVSDEEMVVIHVEGKRILAKVIDLSDSGTLVYSLEELRDTLENNSLYRLSLYHQGKIFTVAATMARATGRLVAFRFRIIDPDASADLQAKLIRMEVEWSRIQRLIGN